MAHAPERVEQYVCLNCQVTYAGSVTTEGGEHHFHPPDDCPVCGDDPAIDSVAEATYEGRCSLTG